ncbi:MAG: hypothetical protein P1V35_01345 [Planctomycetota bacterium]|nr:hypothetical protein [Planctomycetota bacterium]
MRHLTLLFALATCWLGSCVSSPIPLAGGQVQRDRICQWLHLELQLVVDQRSEHLKGTARLHLRALVPGTSTIPVNMGSLRLAGPAKDSSGRDLERGPDGGWMLNAPLDRGEEEVLEIRFDATAGPGLAFETNVDGDWIRLQGGAFFPRIAGLGHHPTMDVGLYAGGARPVMGPGQRLPSAETGVGPAPAHFRLAQPTDPNSVNYLVGPLESVQLSGSDQGWFAGSVGQFAPGWSQAWMWARTADTDPGAPCRVAFLPESFGLAGWQGGWSVVPVGPAQDVESMRGQCRRLVIEQSLVAGLLPDPIEGRDLIEGFVTHACMGEGLGDPEEAPTRMVLGLQAMERELGERAFADLRTEFLELYQGLPMGVWEWARFSEHRVGLSAPGLFQSLTGR